MQLVPPSGGWSPLEVHALLSDPDAIEWRDKVGVAGAADGSGKPTTRLLATAGRVAKTRIDHARPSAAEALAVVAGARARGLAARLWHPDKQWAVIEVDGQWYPLTICPRLVTLRDAATLAERRRGWTRMLQLGIDVDRVHAIGLDLNPSNFGFAPGDDRMYYIDDELYAPLSARELAGAVAARIPEHPDATPEVWSAWGRELRDELVLGDMSWVDIRDEVARYPIAERFEAASRALAGALVDRPRAGRSERALVCVLADVHGNLPALDAVLDDARAHGATGFLFLGDAVGYGPWPRECVRRLAELPGPGGVRGNHDHAIASGHFELGMNRLARQSAEWTRDQLSPGDLAWLAGLPTERTGAGWLAVHGAPKDPQRLFAYVYEMTYEDNLRHLREHRIPLCFCGHTHAQLIHVELAGRPSKLPGARSLALDPRHHWIVNPGSVGQPRDGDSRAAYALWHVDTGALETRRVAYDLERTARAITAAGLPSQLEHRLRVGS